jgi:hypothetical protein
MGQTRQGRPDSGFVYQISEHISKVKVSRTSGPFLPLNFCRFFSHFLRMSQEVNCHFVVRWICSQVCQVSDQTSAEECECSMSLIDGSDYQSWFVKNTRERIRCLNGKSAFNCITQF